MCGTRILLGCLDTVLKGHTGIDIFLFNLFIINTEATNFVYFEEL